MAEPNIDINNHEYYVGRFIQKLYDGTTELIERADKGDHWTPVYMRSWAQGERILLNNIRTRYPKLIQLNAEEKLSSSAQLQEQHDQHQHFIQILRTKHADEIKEIQTQNDQANNNKRLDYERARDSALAQQIQAAKTKESEHTENLKRLQAIHSQAMEEKRCEYFQQLNQIHATHSQALKTKEDQHAEQLNQNLAIHSQALEAKENQHAKQLNWIQAANSQILETKEDEQTALLNQIQAKHSQALEKRQSEYMFKLNQQQQKNEKAAIDERVQHTTMLAETTSRHSLVLETLQSEHAKSVNFQKLEHHSDVSGLKTEHSCKLVSVQMKHRAKLDTVVFNFEDRIRDLEQDSTTHIWELEECLNLTKRQLIQTERDFNEYRDSEDSIKVSDHEQNLNKLQRSSNEIKTLEQQLVLYKAALTKEQSLASELSEALAIETQRFVDVTEAHQNVTSLLAIARSENETLQQNLQIQISDHQLETRILTSQQLSLIQILCDLRKRTTTYGQHILILRQKHAASMQSAQSDIVLIGNKLKIPERRVAWQHQNLSMYRNMEHSVRLLTEAVSGQSTSLTEPIQPEDVDETTETAFEHEKAVMELRHKTALDEAIRAGRHQLRMAVEALYLYLRDDDHTLLEWVEPEYWPAPLRDELELIIDPNTEIPSIRRRPQLISSSSPVSFATNQKEQSQTKRRLDTSPSDIDDDSESLRPPKKQKVSGFRKTRHLSTDMDDQIVFVSPRSYLSNISQADPQTPIPRAPILPARPVLESAHSPDEDKADIEHHPSASCEVSLIDLSADYDVETKVNKIWSMFAPAWSITDEEATILKTQFRSLFNRSASHSRSLKSVVEAIDLYIFGDLSKAPLRPSTCLMARLTSSTPGIGGSSMCANNCKYCKSSKITKRICCWAEYVPGVQPGCTATRVNGRVSKQERIWSEPMADLTVVLHDNNVRWILRKRKVLVGDPDIVDWHF